MKAGDLMSGYGKRDFEDSDFSELDAYAKRKKENISQNILSGRSSSLPDTSGILIENDGSSAHGFSSSNRVDDGRITQYIPPHKPRPLTKKDPTFEYKPENLLIRRVRIFSQTDGHIFGGDSLFNRERRALLNRVGVEAPYASFFSFSPRYSQMSRAQTAWYLWWRENVRNGNMIPTDISYVKLYVQELIVSCAEDGQDPVSALDSICALLTLPQKKDGHFINLADIIFDFCLVYKLDIPVKILKKYQSSLVLSKYHDEFFFGLSAKNRFDFAPVAIGAVSVYNYKKSKYRTEENSSLFDIHILGAMNAALSDDKTFEIISSLASGIFNNAVTERKLFIGTGLATCGIIAEICSYPLSCISGIITDIVRYSENCLREHMGIKSKLSVLSLDGAAVTAVDRYFEENLPKSERQYFKKAKQEPIPEYEKLYEQPKRPISLENAEKIESDSWETTRLLTEAFGGEDIYLQNTVETAALPEISPKPTDLLTNATEIRETTSTQDCPTLYCQILASLPNTAEFIRLCIGEVQKSKQSAFSRALSMTADEIADEINEVSLELLGDILLEEQDGVYYVIEDYADDLTKGIRSNDE